MKKVLFTALIVLLLLSSCTLSKDCCYYAYFGDSAFIIVYSGSKNSLYRIDIPVDILVVWAKNNGYTNMKDAMLDYVQLRADGFIVGNKESHQALNEIINALAGRTLTTSQEKMELISEKKNVIGNSQFVENINTLCSANLSELAKIIRTKDPLITCFNAGEFLVNDSGFSQKYFTQWLGQIL